MSERNDAPIAEVISVLVEGLGPGLTDGLLGTWGPLKPEWSMGTVAPWEAEGRLRSAHQVFTLIEDAEDRHMARALMIGMNPRLNDEAMITAIAEGRFRDVRLAVEAYLAYGY